MIQIQSRFTLLARLALLAAAVCCFGCSGDQQAASSDSLTSVSPQNPTSQATDAEAENPEVDPANQEATSGPAENRSATNEPAGPQEAVSSQDSKPKDSKPTEHTNRLAKETSPYLLLHAHNPVDWYPWGPEALKKAKDEKKLIFLSIGYSSCHWCHVMERESFLDPEIAKLMNKNFVCIKVDREERPDIDTIYMTALQVYFQLAGSPQSGGWPLSMFLTPEGEPFFGGSYFPARDGDRGPMIGFLTVLQKVSDVWEKQPDRLQQDAKTLTRLVKQQLEGRSLIDVEPVDISIVQRVRDNLSSEFDKEYGGFGYNLSNPNRPKFPEPSNLFFLLAQVSRSGDLNSPEAQMLTATLDRLAMGGIRDHLGGGFHRYSVDRFWHIPHFEKMLYDNGQLASVYAEAFALTKDEQYRRITDEMLAFVLREMTTAEGGFHSALDAESEGEEGKFYRWEREQVKSAVSDDEYKLFAEVYGLDSPPNFEDEYYAPQFEEPLTAIAKKMGKAPAELESLLAPIRQKLLALRDKRKRPLTDSKILTGWNGLMIRGFADAGRVFENKKYVQAAEKAAGFVLTKLRSDDGRLLRTYGNGEAKLNAYLPDYAFMIDGLIALHRATGEHRWLDEAAAMQATQIKLHQDERNGGFYFTSGDHEALLARSKKYYDGAQPSGNSVSAENLVYLGRTIPKAEYIQLAEKVVQSAAEVLGRSPNAAPRMVLALQEINPASQPDASAKDKQPVPPAKANQPDASAKDKQPDPPAKDNQPKPETG